MLNSRIAAPDPLPLARRVQQLRAAVYVQPDQTANLDLLPELAQAEAALRAAEVAARPAPAIAPTGAAPAGRMLGPNSTQLKVEPTPNMHPVPTAIYPLLDPETDPLLTVAVTNLSLNAGVKRVCVRAWIEGLSAESVRTVELPRGMKEPKYLKLLPLLFPERARMVTEVQRATLHLQVEDLDTKKAECHDTFSLVLLARTSGFNTSRDPATGEQKDLTHYYGAWVTPHAEAVQERIRRAAALHPDRMLAGCVQPGADSVRQQVAALYQSLRECEIAYINAVTSFGATKGTVTQRARLPRESLTLKSANCIDGPVLFASLLQGASLSPALLILPGHVFVGWESDQDVGDWQFLETTLIGTRDFDDSCRVGQRQYDEYRKHDEGLYQLHRVAELRERFIWPME